VCDKKTYYSPPEGIWDTREEGVLLGDLSEIDCGTEQDNTDD